MDENLIAIIESAMRETPAINFPQTLKTSLIQYFKKTIPEFLGDPPHDAAERVLYDIKYSALVGYVSRYLENDNAKK